MNFFRKRSAEKAQGDTPKRDKERARRFFEQAKALSEASSYDQAIEVYINGLENDPGNIIQHKNLYELSLKRKVAGGKPAGFRERLSIMTGDAVRKMLLTERLWAKDPLNQELMIKLMKQAVAADQAEPDLKMGGVVLWVGKKILEGHQVDR